MANELNEEAIKIFANEYTEDVKAEASESGESNQIQMLFKLKDDLGESKLINDPHFFYWKHTINPLIIELYGYDVDEYDNSISIFVSDFGEPYHPILKQDVDKAGNRALNFVRCALENNRELRSLLENEESDLWDDVVNLNETESGISKIKVIFVSNGKNNIRKRELRNTLKGHDIDVEYIVWDICWIYENSSQTKEHETVSLDFKDEDLSGFVNGGLPFLEVPQSEAIFDCYQCIVPGRLLSYIYRIYGSPLLEGNVRSFLSTKTSVNAKIQETICREPKRFYIYNNGIAAVASGVDIEKVDGRNLITRINDIQIINGGQTTASLAYAELKRKYDLSDVFVPMKLTIIHSGEERGENQYNELIQKISRTSNRQNMVSDADFFSNHPFHLRMKKFSEDLSVPGQPYNTYWFYERARGEYAQGTMFKTELQKGMFIKKHPKSMFIRKTDFAKYYNLLALHPDIVSKGSVTNFNDFAKYVDTVYENKNDAIFNEFFFKEVIGVARMYRTIEPLITKNNQSWYEGSYRANIISYAISLFFYLLKNQYPDESFDFSLIWNKGVSQKLIDQLIELCQLVYSELVSDDRKVLNVTQWAKKEDCWKNMKKKLGDIKISSDAVSYYLKDKAVIIAEKKKAKKDQNIQNEVSNYSVAFDAKHAKLWEPLFYFIQEKKNFFPSFGEAETIALDHMVRALKGKVTPTTEDCSIALKLLKDAELLGFGN